MNKTFKHYIFILVSFFCVAQISLYYKDIDIEKINILYVHLFYFIPVTIIFLMIVACRILFGTNSSGS